MLGGEFLLNRPRVGVVGASMLMETTDPLGSHDPSNPSHSRVLGAEVRNLPSYSAEQGLIDH